MAFKPTREQSQAIEAKGNILVSAAAGSGKTAVLVERVIAKLCSEKDPVSADRLLIVTFTNAAAAEMRTRIEKRLDEECRKRPNDIGLLLQKRRLSNAKICTIDSFCIDLVRENFERLDISPDFKMSDGGSLKAIDGAVLSRITARYLEEKNPVFEQLLDIIGSEYDESNFEKFVSELYNYSRQLAFPDKWFDSLCGLYSDGGFNNVSPWWQYAFRKAVRVLEETICSLENAIELLGVSEKAFEKYSTCFLQAIEGIKLLRDRALESDWDSFYNALNDFKLPSLPVVRGVSDIFEVTAAKDIYKHTDKKALEGLKKIFFADNAFIDRQFEALHAPLCLLSDILKQYEAELFDEYKAQNTFTFHNTEHLALRLLCSEEWESPVEEGFCEVMVDEYQDTNDLQDMLFYVLSSNEKRLFVVGDIKQSIYGFRGANPKNFLNKKNRYIPIASATPDEPQKIILGNNFRCKPEVCDFINFFFELFMNGETGEIVYNEEERLIPAARFPEVEGRAVQLHIISKNGSEKAAAVLEAAHIADFIRKTMAEGKVIKQADDTLREARFSDFTVLLRSAKNKAPVMAAELKRQGIPVNCSNEGFCESVEISTVLALLKVIDNPQSDIELLTVMLSKIFCFTPEEVAQLRIAKRDGTLYSAVIFAAENGDTKACELLEGIRKYRLYEVSNTLPRLIALLLAETGYLDTVSAMPDGLQRKNNLLLLQAYAEQYCEGTGGSVGGFVRYIIAQAATGLKAAAAPTGGDTVKIMSIHASKGLQFPICIIADTASDFNDSEARSGAVYSTEWGIGFKYFDEDSHSRLTTVGREVILDIIRRERLEEELRLFYVALTRTQDRLLVTSCVSDVEKKAESLKSVLLSSGGEFNSALFERARSYSDWMLLSLLVHPDGQVLRGVGHSIIVRPTDSKAEVRLINAEDIPDCPKNEVTEPAANLETVNKISDIIKYSYPFEPLSEIEAKASASRLTGKAEAVSYAFSDKPAFMQSGNLTSAQRGTAMHKAMQFFDFKEYANVEAELERLYEWQFISEAEYNSLNKKQLKGFFEGELFSRIQKSERVEREMRFLTELPARIAEPTLDERFESEKIIVQGAVDLCFTEPDGLVIVDFKSDRVKEPEALLKAYAEQLDIYAKACEKIFEMPIKQKIIYSFSLSREIICE